LQSWLRNISGDDRTAIYGDLQVQLWSLLERAGVRVRETRRSTVQIESRNVINHSKR
jgi:hypothetical protein